MPLLGVYLRSQRLLSTRYPKEKDDIAILTLTEKIEFWDTDGKIAPVCLPPGRSNAPYEGVMATIAGWGITFKNRKARLPEQLLYAKVPLISNNDCKKWHEPRLITDKKICGGFKEGGTNTCYGDSGGPVVLSDDNGRSYQEGIVSWNIGKFKLVILF